jgi:hypothetical protein
MSPETLCTIRRESEDLKRVLDDLHNSRRVARKQLKRLGRMIASVSGTAADHGDGLLHQLALEEADAIITDLVLILESETNTLGASRLDGNSSRHLTWHREALARRP